MRHFLFSWSTMCSFCTNVASVLDTTLVIFNLPEATYQETDIYPVCLCLGATGPFYAGYMLSGGYSWRLYFYVEIAFAGALLILAFLFVEESLYHRKPIQVQDTRFSDLSDSKVGITSHQQDSVTSLPKRKSFLSTLKPWGSIDRDADFFGTMWRPFTYFFVPAVFWVITTYGEP